MAQYEIIAMAKEAGMVTGPNLLFSEGQRYRSLGAPGNIKERHLLRFAALVAAKERERWSEVEQYLVAAAAGSMSRNNSEQIASELLEQIHDTSRTR